MAKFGKQPTEVAQGKFTIVVTNSYDHKDVLCFADSSDQKGCQGKLLASVGPRQGKRGEKRDRYQNNMISMQ